MSISDKKGISVTSGFKLISRQPLDARLVVDDLDGLQDLVNNGAAYEGIVVYVKSEQKLKQYNGSEWSDVSSGGSGGGSSDFINVDELPDVFVGTEVPSSGMVEKIYFNTNLSNNEIIDIMSNVNLVQVPGFSGDLYAVVTTADFSNALAITKDTGDDDRYIVQVVNGEQNLLWSSRNGWVVNDWEINYGYNNMLSVVAPQLGGTVQNDRLKNLISITPFELNSEIDLSKIYRIPNYSFGGGAVIPNSGTVGKVYFNTSLSDSEVEALLSQLTYDPNMEYSNSLLCVRSGESAPTILIVAVGMEGMYALLDFMTYKVYWANQAIVDDLGLEFGITTAGWQNFDNPIEINAEVLADINGDGSVIAGEQNDLIKELFYTEPLVDEELIGYNYYRVIDGEWAEVLGEAEEVDLSSYEKVKTAITVPQPGETDGFTFTDSQIELIKSGSAFLQFTDNMNITHKINHVGALGEAPLFMGIIYMYFVFAIVVYTVDYENKTIAGASGQSLINDVELRVNGYKNNEWVDDNRNYENAYMQLEVWNGEENLSSFDLAKVIVGDPEDTANQPTFYGVKKYVDEQVANAGGGLTESDVNQLIADYMTTNYGNGDEEEY